MDPSYDFFANPKAPTTAVPTPGLAVPRPTGPGPVPTPGLPPVPDAGRTTTLAPPNSRSEPESGAFLTHLLSQLVQRKASDLHVTSGAPPMLRLNGQLVAIEGEEPLSTQFLQRMLYAIITQRQRERFEDVLELDFAHAAPNLARFRVNMYRQRQSVGAAFRLIPYEIKQLEELGVPAQVAAFAQLPRGFVLVTGPTGSGKSTTLAALVDLANRTRHDHIVTVEDPIEFLHSHKACLVNQREVGEDTHSFSNALKHVLRQDPDIILVGEMRDL